MSTRVITVSERPPVFRTDPVAADHRRQFKADHQFCRGMKSSTLTTPLLWRRIADYGPHAPTGEGPDEFAEAAQQPARN
jgi:hypothetical protein